MRNTKLQLFFIIIFSILSYPLLNGQTKIVNNAFDAGENLTYDLYYKYGILNMRGGIATLNTESTTYNDKNAYKLTLHATTRGLIGNIYSVDDTLTSYMDKDLVPLLFVKGAAEMNDYTR